MSDTQAELVGAENDLMLTEQNIRVVDIKNEIIPENRICTLEQAEVYVKAVESFMEEMQPEETRYDRSVYRTNKEKDGWSR